MDNLNLPSRTLADILIECIDTIPGTFTTSVVRDIFIETLPKQVPDQSKLSPFVRSYMAIKSMEMLMTKQV